MVNTVNGTEMSEHLFFFCIYRDTSKTEHSLQMTDTIAIEAGFRFIMDSTCARMIRITALPWPNERKANAITSCAWPLAKDKGVKNDRKKSWNL
jgi:hypothetical protein